MIKEYQDRFFISNRRIDFCEDFLFDNLYRNKGIYVSKGIDMTKHNKLEDDILLLMEGQISKTDIFIENIKNDVEFHRHNIPMFLENNTLDSDDEKSINTNFRINNNLEFFNLESQLFDNKFGVIFNMYADIFSKEYMVMGAEISPLPRMRILEVGYGRSLDVKKSKNEAILEALERYSLFSIENPEKIERLSNTIAIKYPKEFDKLISKNIFCVDGTDERNGKKVIVPTQMVNFKHVEDFDLVNETSNGVAVGASLFESKLFGLLEFIERDAFLVFWLKRIILKRIKISSLSKYQIDIINDFENTDKKVYLFDLRIDINMPTILCLIISKKELPATYVSTAANINLNSAIDGALKEAIVAHNIYQNDSNLDNPPKVVSRLEDHYKYYATLERVHTYDFLIKKSEEVDLNLLYKNYHYNFETINTDKKAYEFVLKSIPNKYDVFSVNLSSHWMGKLGLYSTKTLIPGMQTMYFGVDNQRINIERVEYSSQNSINNLISLEEKGRINDAPHPFP
ncbi:YcaO-like family protein [Lactobacillus sp. DCY120]|uniref:YcaO-like family protein n=1 Tax=Bombilactobacillus apium TaxID=2675299 RepID=A0A850QZG8_9LACO|nr:YcaO-like family protein [Bombilactobacillus apium]NVY96179.1 YcaO-like family protein [Bombilactobacillus apium]